MKKVLKFGLVLSLALFCGIAAKAQVVTGWTNFKHSKVVYVCSSRATAIDMGIELFGVHYSANAGNWYEVKPYTHSDGTVALDPADILVGPPAQQNIFNASRPVGVYDFVFVTTAANFCGMTTDDQSMVRIHVVPELKDASGTVQICGDETATIDLINYVDQSIVNFATTYGWDIVFSGTGVTNNQVTVNKTTGTKTYTYTVDDSQGAHAGMYAASACKANASVVVSVEVTNEKTVAATGALTECIGSLANITSQTVNTPNLLNPYAVGGTWATSSANATIVAATGIATIDVDAVRTAGTYPVAFTFTYTYTDCDNATKTSVVTYTITDDLSTELVNRDTTLCRNSLPGSIDLLSFFYGVNFPSTVGSWTGPANIPVTNGTINATLLQVGTQYTFNYQVYPSATDMCNIAGKTATLTLNVDETAILSGQAQMCKATATSGTTDLAVHVANLPASGVKWYKYNSATSAWDTEITSTVNSYPNTDLIAGPNEFRFTYNTSCGNSSGSLFLTVVDSVTNYHDVLVKYCVTDQGTDVINLMQLLGVAGAEGTISMPSPSVGQINNYNTTTKVFNGRGAYTEDNVTGNKEYTFVFTPAANAGCIANSGPVTIKVVVTPDVVTP